MEAQSRYVVAHINKFLLDPNNYRLVDKEAYKPINPVELSDARVQQRTYNLLVGANHELIRDLINSFKNNGILRLDAIQVKPLGEYFLVIEGNRRMAALKYLYEESKKGNDIGKLNVQSFERLDAVLNIGESEVQHLITMGLHHISGKQRWNSYNQALLMRDLSQTYKLSEEEICNVLAISRQMLRRTLRALALIEKYKESDFGDQFKSDMYWIFEEIVRSTELKKWLGWDDQKLFAINDANEYKLFAWLSPEEKSETDEDGNLHNQKRDPIISKRDEIRTLAKFIHDPKALEVMEQKRNISEGYSLSGAVGETRLSSALEAINKEVQTTSQFSDLLKASDHEMIAKLRDKLDRLIPGNRAVFEAIDRRSPTFFESNQGHFSEILIKNYRKLVDLKIGRTSRVNLFAGGNNTGKTSVLEACFLLTQLNNIPALVELERYRGKFYQDFHTRWIDKNFSASIDLEGSFNGTLVSLSVQKYDTTEAIDRSQYLSSIKSEAAVNGTNFEGILDLYANRAPELYFQKSQVLCQAAFSSPYRHNAALLKRAHTRAVQEKYLEDIVSFLRRHMDEGIERIEMVNIEGESRFMVSSKWLKEAIDSTKYGEGLQRVFEIALLLGYCRNGVLCIDELDSAIHKNLLLPFTQFIQELAAQFNVQVFLSTHSKECIDAFVENGHDTEHITAYALTEENGHIACRHVAGTRLAQLVESINFDIRVQ